MTGTASTVDSTPQARVRDLFLLETAEKVVRSFTPEQHEAVRKRFEAAQRRASVADDLSDERNVAVAFVLYREAVTLLIGSVLLSRDAQANVNDLSTATAFERLNELAKAGLVPPPLDFVAETRTLLSEDGQLAFDRRAPEDLLGRRTSVESTLRWLQDLIEPRTLGEIRALRAVRLFMMGVAVLCLLVWGTMRLTRTPNIALGKPVSASGRHPSSTAPADNSGLVNGDIESTYGIHTAPAAAGSFAWVMLDLGAPTSVGKVKVYNRADGWFDEQLPLTMEFSDDATNFTVVDQRTTGYSSRAPWVYEAKSVKTRYIRVRSNSYVAITEIEVNP